MSSDNLEASTSIGGLVDSQSPGEKRDLLKHFLGTVFSLGMNVMIIGALYLIVSHFLSSHVTAPITSTPQAVYVGIVNPVSLSGGYVPGIWSASMPNGDTCYVVMGVMDDTISCVAGTPE